MSLKRSINFIRIIPVCIFIFLTTAFISCMKNDITHQTPIIDDLVIPSDSILLVIKKNAVIIEEFTYRNDHKLQMLVFNSDSGVWSHTYDLFYSPQGKLNKIHSMYVINTLNTYDSCYYNSDDRISSIISYGDFGLSYIQTLQYDNAGRLKYVRLEQGGGVYGTNYIYGSNDNVVKEYGSDDLVCDTTYYGYDQHKGFKFKGYPALLPFGLSNNNIVYKLHKDQSGNVKPDDSYSSVFEYNSNGFPQKETRTYQNGKVDVYDFIYL